MTLVKRPPLTPPPLVMDAAAAAVVAAYTGATASERDRRLINNMVIGLKAAGLWALIETLWVPAAKDAASGYINWKTPGTNTLVPQNAPGFTAYGGLISDGTTSYCKTGLFLGVGGGHVTSQNSVTLTVTLASDLVGGADIVMGENNCRLAPRSAGGSMSVRLHSAASFGAPTTGTVTTTAGVSLLVTRTGASNTELFQDGVSLGANVATTSQAPTTNEIFLLANANGVNPNGWSARRVAMAAVLAGLTPAQAAAFQAITRTYLNAVNPAVFP